MKNLSLFLLGTALTLSSVANAQREPHIGYIYPAGGKQSSTFTATLGGTSLEGVTNVYFSGTGITATILKYERQVTPTEQDNLVKRLHQLQETRKTNHGWTTAEETEAADIRKTLNGFGRQLVSSALNQFVTLQVTIAPKAATGAHEIRLGTSVGLSNPLKFYVDDLPELSKPDWKNIPSSKDSTDPDLSRARTETRITLPTILNGQLLPGGVDRYRFSAKQGQQLTVIASARDLLPYLADAVPGWLQATLALYDAAGKELEYDDDYQFRPDPVLMFRIPRDGEYSIQIRDALYRGREDFVYRLTIGELPFVTGIFPLGGQSGTQTTVALGGWNLPQNQTTLDLRNIAPCSYPFAIRSGNRLSNRVPFIADALPEYFEHEPNNTLTNAEACVHPGIINGRIAQPGDVDIFRITGQVGERLVAEVQARRLNSALDSFLKLTDAAGTQIAFNDDHEDKASGLDTHHADSYFATTLPSNGTYFVHIGDTQHKGGWNYAYRLRISAPRPDYALRVTPSSLNLRPGTSAALTVHALRQDGFSGPINLTLKNAPTGFTLNAAQVPANQTKVKVTLTSPATAQPAPLNLQIEGHAQIQSREITHVAIPADDLTQAFAYRHLVPAQELKVSVWGSDRLRPSARIISPTPIKIPAGGSARIEVYLPTDSQMGKIEFDLPDAPDGLALQRANPGSSSTEIFVQADAAKLKPGTQGNLVIRAFAERAPQQSATETVPQNKRRIPLGALPAIPFEITAH